MDLFSGRYDLGDVLGSGGSGVVRVAHDSVLDRRVAIKLLRAGVDDSTLRERLRTEAQLAGSLHHPGIAQIYDYGEADVDGEPTPYIAMQYVEGTSLWVVLRDRRTMPVDEVLDLVAQVSDALEVAHARGIVHRDLKPSNVLLTESGRAVLVDFGIARTADAEPLTVTGTLIGTADYVSPEQCLGEPATTRSDLYSLGMLAYECLTGHKPFHRESPVATAMAHLNDEVPALPDDVPAPVRDLVMALVSKAPEDRPVSAAAVAARARALLETRGDATAVLTVTSISDRILPPAPTPLREAAVATPPWQRAALKERRIQVAVAAVGVVLLGTAFVAARPASARTVPDLSGMSWSEARSELRDAGLEPKREAVDELGADAGDVVTQVPAAGSSIDEDGTVTVSVASGVVQLAMSDVVGKPYDEAVAVLEDLGLTASRNEVERPGADGVTVVTASPTGRVHRGDTITLNVGVAPEAETTYTPTPPGHGHGKGHGPKPKKPKKH